MALRYGYFDSEITGIDEEGMPIFDRAETSDFIAYIYRRMFSDGIIDDIDEFKVSPGSGMTLSVGAGFGMIKGRFVFAEDAESITLNAAHATYPRIDSIVLRLNLANKLIELMAIQGTAASSPIEPDLVRTDEIYDLCLANIQIPAGATSITEDYITDMRDDKFACGRIYLLGKIGDGLEVVEMPRQVGTLSYTGETQEPVWSHYTEEEYILGGTYMGINVGSYTATFKPNTGYKWADKTRNTKDAVWTIEKASLNIPVIMPSNYTYDGTEKAAVFTGFDANTMSISGNTGTDAGTYTVSIALLDPNNYEWSDGTTANKTYTWSIAKVSVTIPAMVAETLTYDGTVKSISFTVVDTSKETITGNSATNAGSYTASITLNDTVNYQWSDGKTAAKTYSWSIGKQRVTIPSLNSYSFTYDGTEKTVTFSGYDSDIETVSGATATAAGSHTATITLKSTDNYEWTDGKTTAKTFAWSIGKAYLAIPTLNSHETFVYSPGTTYTVYFTGFDSDLMTVTGNSGTNAGTYTAYIALQDKNNYAWTGGSTANQSYSWSIEKATISVPVPTSSSSLTYTGEELTYNITTSGTLTTISGNTATNVGSYTASVSINDTSNYKWEDNTTGAKQYTWSIVKAALTIPTIQTSSFTYDGNSKSPTFSGYDSDTMSISGDSETSAGTYTATISLRNTSSYRWSDGTTTSKTYSWTIAKATGTITLSKSSITFNDSTASDTVTVQKSDSGTVTVTSSLPDNFEVSISGSTITVNTINAVNSRCTITVAKAETSNYTAATKTITITSSFTIVSWSGGTDAQIAVMLSLAKKGILNIYDHWSVGDTRNITLSAVSAYQAASSIAAQTATLRLVESDPSNYSYVDTLESGRTKPFFIACFTETLTTTDDTPSNMVRGSHGTYSSYPQLGDWTSSRLKYWCNNVLIGAFSDSVLSYISDVNIKAMKDNLGTWSLAEFECKFFLPALRELVNVTASYVDKDQERVFSKWDYFQDDPSITSYPIQTRSPDHNNTYDSSSQQTPPCQYLTAEPNSSSTKYSKYESYQQSVLLIACCI